MMLRMSSTVELLEMGAIYFDLSKLIWQLAFT